MLLHSSIKRKEEETIKKEELVRAIAVESGTTQVEAERILDAFIRVARNTLIENRNEKISLPNLCSFTIKEYKNKKYINPTTGEKHVLPVHRTLRCTPSRTMMALLNGEENEV